jgi:hypothetical protein
MEVFEAGLEVFSIRPPCDAVHTSCGIPLQPVIGRAQEIDANMVEQRSELSLLPLPCGLPYTVQPLGHAVPALRPARARPSRVSLGLPPFLHRLRRRSRDLVRRLHRYYGGV